jgi:hypothetical protein
VCSEHAPNLPDEFKVLASAPRALSLVGYIKKGPKNRTSTCLNAALFSRAFGGEATV